MNKSEVKVCCYFRKLSDEKLLFMLRSGALVFEHGHFSNRENIKDPEEYDAIARVRYLLVEEVERRGLELTLWDPTEVARVLATAAHASNQSQ